RYKAVLLGLGQPQQRIGLLPIRAIQGGITEDRIGPQAAGAAVARLAPVEQMRALLHQSQTGSCEGLFRSALGGQAIGDSGQVALVCPSAVTTQAATDTADRALRV